MKRVVPFLFICLCVVGLLAVMDHLLRILPPSGMIIPPGPEWYTTHREEYESHALLTYSHLIPASLFVTIAPFQFWPNFRKRYRMWHRVTGLVFIGSTVLTGITGALLGMKIPFGGALESVGGWLAFATVTFFVLRAWQAIKSRDVRRHREWMIRTFSIGAGVASMRVLDGVFYPFHWVEDRTIFQVAMYLGFIMNYLVAEYWIRHTRSDGVRIK